MNPSFPVHSLQMFDESSEEGECSILSVPRQDRLSSWSAIDMAEMEQPSSPSLIGGSLSASSSTYKEMDRQRIAMKHLQLRCKTLEAQMDTKDIHIRQLSHKLQRQNEEARGALLSDRPNGQVLDLFSNPAANFCVKCEETELKMQALENKLLCAEKDLKRKEEHSVAQAILLNGRIQEYKNEVDTLELQLSKAEILRAAAERRLRESEERQRGKESIFRNSSKELMEKLKAQEAALLASQAEKREVDAQLDICESKLNEAQNELQGTRKCDASSRRQVEELIQKLNALRANCEGLEEQVETLQKEEIGQTTKRYQEEIQRLKSYYEEQLRQQELLYGQVRHAKVQSMHDCGSDACVLPSNPKESKPHSQKDEPYICTVPEHEMMAQHLLCLQEKYEGTLMGRENLQQLCRYTAEGLDILSMVQLDELRDRIPQCGDTERLKELTLALINLYERVGLAFNSLSAEVMAPPISAGISHNPPPESDWQEFHWRTEFILMRKPDITAVMEHMERVGFFIPQKQKNHFEKFLGHFSECVKKVKACCDEEKELALVQLIQHYEQERTCDEYEERVSDLGHHVGKEDTSVSNDLSRKLEKRMHFPSFPSIELSAINQAQYYETNAMYLEDKDSYIRELKYRLNDMQDTKSGSKLSNGNLHLEHKPERDPNTLPENCKADAQMEKRDFPTEVGNFEIDLHLNHTVERDKERCDRNTKKNRRTQKKKEQQAVREMAQAIRQRLEAEYNAKLEVLNDSWEFRLQAAVAEINESWRCRRDKELLTLYDELRKIKSKVGAMSYIKE